MPLFRVDPASATRLVGQPESGMGYQVVQYREAALVVFNAMIAIPLAELTARRFTADDYSCLAGDPEQAGRKDLEILRLSEDLSVEFSTLDPSLRRETFGLSFSEAAAEPPEWTINPKAPHSYYRFSSFYRDRRVDAQSGDLLAGTFATTFADLHFVPSGFAAVGRYAFPNPASARFVFQVVTYDRPSLMGTATPNFGQAGGGVEALFKNRARNSPGRSFAISFG